MLWHSTSYPHPPTPPHSQTWPTTQVPPRTHQQEYPPCRSCSRRTGCCSTATTHALRRSLGTTTTMISYPGCLRSPARSQQALARLPRCCGMRQSVADETRGLELGCHLFPVNSIGYGGVHANFLEALDWLDDRDPATRDRTLVRHYPPNADSGTTCCSRACAAAAWPAGPCCARWRSRWRRPATAPS